MPTIKISSIFDAPADRVWEEANMTRLLNYVTRGRIAFDPIDPPQFPERWAEGEYKVAMRGFGTMPLGSQTIGIEFPPPQGDTRILRDNGHGRFFRKWDHRIFVEPMADGRTRYTDELDFDAGVLNAIAKPIVREFYQHRQARWKKLIANDFRY